jgi:hypothetical protein
MNIDISIYFIKKNIFTYIKSNINTTNVNIKDRGKFVLNGINFPLNINKLLYKNNLFSLG